MKATIRPTIPKIGGIKVVSCIGFPTDDRKKKWLDKTPTLALLTVPMQPGCGGSCPMSGAYSKRIASEEETQVFLIFIVFSTG